MSPIKPKKNISKKISAILITTLLLAIVAAGYMAQTKTGLFHSQSPQTVNNDSNTPLTDKELGVKPATQTDPSSNSAKKNDPNDIPTPDDELIDITSTQHNQNTYIVRTLIKKLTNKGTCRLVAQGPQGSHTETVGVQASASASTCKGFSIPVEKLGAGRWTIQITYTEGSTSSFVAKEVVVNA